MGNEIELNVRQKNAVKADEPKILCLASAASGKTRTLTERIKFLILRRKVRQEDIVAITFTNAAAQEMHARLGTLGDKVFIGTIHSYANRLCVNAGIDTSKIIMEEKYDDLLRKAMLIPRSNLKTIQHLLIDECQDIGKLEFRFLTYLKKHNEYWTGDEKQCQPAGTKVLLRNNIIKNIEDVEVGDSVCYYESHQSYVSGIITNKTSKEKKVLKTAVRNFCNDELITITTESGLTSTYTPNHKTYVRVSGCSNKNYAVYLMCDDDYRFRVGKIAWTASENAYHKNPWRGKMYAEGCTKIWILKIFETDKDARVFENKISYTYGIPQICWQQDKVMWTDEDIDYIYEELDTYESAKRCLKKYHRDINYPLLDKNWTDNEQIHFARNAVTVCYAANLMDEGMEVIVYDRNERKRKRYEKIVKIEYQYITEPIPVYSLEVEGGNYFADEILTHNCIYAFKGASDEYLRDMYEDEEYKKYYLVENYRNTPEIITFAETFIRQKESLSPSSIPVKTQNGFIEHCRIDEALDELEASGNWGAWFVIARSNRDVDIIMEKLHMKGVPCVTFKRAELDLNQMESLMAGNTVKVMTIHTAKGLESPNVIAVGAKTYNAEERRIAYVAATRAETNLYWCPTITKAEGRKPEGDIEGNYKTKRTGQSAFGEVITF